METKGLQEMFDKLSAKIEDVRREAAVLREKIEGLAKIHESGACCRASAAAGEP